MADGLVRTGQDGYSCCLWRTRGGRGGAGRYRRWCLFFMLPTHAADGVLCVVFQSCFKGDLIYCSPLTVPLPFEGVVFVYAERYLTLHIQASFISSRTLPSPIDHLRNPVICSPVTYVAHSLSFSVHEPQVLAKNVKQPRRWYVSHVQPPPARGRAKCQTIPSCFFLSSFFPYFLEHEAFTSIGELYFSKDRANFQKNGTAVQQCTPSHIRLFSEKETIQPLLHIRTHVGFVFWRTVMMYGVTILTTRMAYFVASVGIHVQPLWGCFCAPHW